MPGNQKDLGAAWPQLGQAGTSKTRLQLGHRAPLAKVTVAPEPIKRSKGVAAPTGRRDNRRSRLAFQHREPVWT